MFDGILEKTETEKCKKLLNSLGKFQGISHLLRNEMEMKIQKTTTGKK